MQIFNRLHFFTNFFPPPGVDGGWCEKMLGLSGRNSFGKNQKFRKWEIKIRRNKLFSNGGSTHYFMFIFFFKLRPGKS